MEYMVILIYVVVMMQFINSKPLVKERSKCRGYSFYKRSAIINMIIGYGGMIAVNLLLRDKGIIPQSFVWMALIGFALVVIYSMYCIYRMMTTAYSGRY